MHLKIETLSLNDDKNGTVGRDSSLPSEQQIRDDVLLLWREEPETEELNIHELYQRITTRNPSWKLSQEDLVAVLALYNLYSTDDKELKGYADRIEFSSVEKSTPVLEIPRGVKLKLCPDGRGRGLFAKKAFLQGDVVFEDLQPLAAIPPIEKLSLMGAGKVCSLCGSSITHSPHFIMMNGLDCEVCGAVWCSAACKKQDITHCFLKHIKGKKKLISPSGWAKYEQYCRENVFVAAYAIGIIYASIIAERGNKNSKDIICKQFASLAQISQRTRRNVSDSTNLGGTFDASSGAVTTEDPEPVWQKAFSLFQESFPHSDISLEAFLIFIGKYNINQVNGQIYTLYSLINHDCEPNVRLEFNGKLGLKLYARKPIQAGEELLTTYVNPLHGSKLRRRELRVNWGFLCHCTRCDRELEIRMSNPTIKSSIARNSLATQKRRKSSMRNARPDLHELLKNGKEFELDIPENPQIGNRRRTSVRFDTKVTVAVEE
ncbi:hypothetical protein HG535_0H04270 [Zygotorulaspora mrakii]|uniref:Histone-lysine N-methyltransferase SET5 n=1 Tax=Zygotorulaspora mrakii TaxID=42260 RepID=A0A7H9B9G8_ZYGMR|nr:uncharacterized protein HG535_0H04270 [Zygotorulaspora mrakii]QLG75100.1 hypothetical protein HG535_0H04270 [Zygotorulaspora mrakii]